MNIVNTFCGVDYLLTTTLNYFLKIFMLEAFSIKN